MSFLIDLCLPALLLSSAGVLSTFVGAPGPGQFLRFAG